MNNIINLNTSLLPLNVRALTKNNSGSPLKTCWKYKNRGNHGLTPLLYIKEEAIEEGFYCVRITAPLHNMMGGYPYFELVMMPAREIMNDWILIKHDEFAKEIINRLNNVFDFLF